MSINTLTTAVALTLLVSVSACARQPAVQASPSMSDLAYIDHIILSIDDLESGMNLLEKSTGVRPVFGGAHPGRGTQNALLSLGNDQYIELLAPNLADTSAQVERFASQLVASFAQFKTPTPNGWAIRVSDADGERTRLISKGFNASEARPGSRARPDGQTLRWKTFDPWGTRNQLLPFVIEWGAGTPHPSTTSPGGCKLVEFAMESPAPDSLKVLFARAGYPLQIRAGEKERLTVTIDCPRGRVSFP